MADICDKADEAEAAIFALRMKHRPSTEIPKGTGACLYCNEPLAHDGRWCDAGCRDDWEKQQRLSGGAA